MYILIVGAGEVGKMIASNLQGSHEVAVVDRDPAIVEELTYEFDVLCVEGDGTELRTLQDAGFEKADLVVACTDNDETNIVVCGAIKTKTDAFTIARVRRHTLFDIWEGSQGAFGVDFMVCSDLLVAQAVFRISGFPHAREIETFAGGLIQMAELEIGSDSPLVGKSVRESDQYDSMTFAGVFREEKMIVAQGDIRFQTGDRVVVIGGSDSLRKFAMTNTSTEAAGANEVVIIGGSRAAFQTAREFESHGFKPKLIEHDPERARELAEVLPNTFVLESDPTDIEFLTREHIGEADIAIAALDTDEKNLLVSLLANRLGVDRTIAIINNREYTNLFETVGIDVAINPREETAEDIIRFTRINQTEKIAMLEHDRAEVIEVVLRDESALAGRKIADSVNDLPQGVVIGAISRGGDLITPRGETVLQPSDHIVLFVDVDHLDEISGIL
jgi:trk system potassium uptake protein